MKLGSFILLLSALAFFVATSLTGAEANRIRGHQRIRRVKEDGDDDAVEDVASTSAEAEEEEAQKDDAELKAAAESEDPKETTPKPVLFQF